MSDVDYISNVAWIMLKNLFLALFSAFIALNLTEMLLVKMGFCSNLSAYYIFMAMLTGQICGKTYVDIEKLNDSGD